MSPTPDVREANLARAQAIRDLEGREQRLEQNAARLRDEMQGLESRKQVGLEQVAALPVAALTSQVAARLGLTPQDLTSRPGLLAAPGAAGLPVGDQRSPGATVAAPVRPGPGPVGVEQTRATPTDRPSDLGTTDGSGDPVSPAAARAATLSETLREGGINLDLAARLADQGRIGFSEYRAAQKAQQLVEKAIAEGKFTPADREVISRLELAEPDRFEAWTRKKPRAVPLGGPSGVSEPPRSPAQDLSVRLTELMREKKLNRQQALQELARTEPELIQRWRWGGGASA